MHNSLHRTWHSALPPLHQAPFFQFLSVSRNKVHNSLHRTWHSAPPLLHQAPFLQMTELRVIVVFTRPHKRCCIRSANYCKFLFITLLVWLADVIALFLVMWPLSWYQFCVSLPLEVRTFSLVLFLQVLTLHSVLHCLPPAGHVEPVFSDSVFSDSVFIDSVFSAAVRRNNSELHNTEKKALFATCRSSVSGNSCHTSLLPLPPADRTSITSRHCEKRAQKATPIEKRREE